MILKEVLIGDLLLPPEFEKGRLAIKPEQAFRPDYERGSAWSDVRALLSNEEWTASYDDFDMRLPGRHQPKDLIATT